MSEPVTLPTVNLTDLTYHVSKLVNKVFENMLSFQSKIPFAICAFLKIIIANAKGLSDLN